MRRILVIPTLALFSIAGVTACGSAAKDTDKSEKSPTKKEPEPTTKQPEQPAVAEVHFDIEKDKSGVLARTASTLETSDQVGTDNPVRGHLADLSHHAEAGASNEALCTHMIGLRSSDVPEACAKSIEHQRVRLGPELFAQVSACILAAKTEAELAACEAAEKEIEVKLHEAKHGDGLSEELCTQMFDHFEKLAMDDAGEQAEIVKEILEEVRADVVVACVDQGMQKEIDCALKATTMAELGACDSSLL